MQNLSMQAIGVSGASELVVPLTTTGTNDSDRSNASPQAQNGNKTAINRVPEELPDQHLSFRDMVYADLLTDGVVVGNAHGAAAAVFDQFILPCYGEIANVDRSMWPLALRWRALNEAMDPSRQKKELPFVRREYAEQGRTTVRVILPD